MTLLVTGAEGQLGRALRQLRPDARFATRADLDLASADSVARYPWDGVTAVVNAAAYTAVDAAEDDPVTAWAVNAHGVAHLAEACARHGARLAQVSTDYVFDGSATSPIPPNTPVGPRSVYGASKAAGELAARGHLVVRTSWVYGDGRNFVRTVRRLAQTRDELTVVDDQLGRPTSALDLARAMLRLLEAGATGLHHAQNEGEVVSWADVAEAACGARIRRVSTTEYGATKAPRPAYSALANTVPMRDWRDALREFLAGE